MSTGAGPVVVEVPADPASLSLVRLVAAAVAAPLGFDVDEIEDLKIAVDELAGALVAVAEGGRITLTYSSEDGRLSAAGRADSTSASLELDDLVGVILDATADGYDLDADGRGFVVRKHRSDR